MQPRKAPRSRANMGEYFGVLRAFFFLLFFLFFRFLNVRGCRRRNFHKTMDKLLRYQCDVVLCVACLMGFIYLPIHMGWLNNHANSLREAQRAIKTLVYILCVVVPSLTFDTVQSVLMPMFGIRHTLQFSSTLRANGNVFDNLFDLSVAFLFLVFASGIVALTFESHSDKVKIWSLIAVTRLLICVFKKSINITRMYLIGKTKKRQ